MKFASASPKATRRIGPGIPPRTSEFQKPNRAAIAVTVVSSGRAFRGVLFGAGRAAQFRGTRKVGWMFTLAAAAHNLVRLPKLLGAVA
jgi:hypothetical protein